MIEFARAENRVCCTLDADFHRHLAVHRMTAPSTIRIRIEGLRGREAADLIVHVVERFGPDLNSGAAVSVTRTSIRVRRLPLVGRSSEEV